MADVPQIACPDCGTPMPYTAAACPTCKRRMVKLSAESATAQRISGLASRVTHAAFDALAAGDLERWGAYREHLLRLWKGRVPGDSQILERLRVACLHPNDSVRWAAARALGDIASDETADLLAGLLNDPAGGVRFAAVSALAAVGDHRAITHLAGLAVSDTTATFSDSDERADLPPGAVVKMLEELLLRVDVRQHAAESDLYRITALRDLNEYHQDDTGHFRVVVVSTARLVQLAKKELSRRATRIE